MHIYTYIYIYIYAFDISGGWPYSKYTQLWKAKNSEITAIVDNRAGKNTLDASLKSRNEKVFAFLNLATTSGPEMQLPSSELGIWALRGSAGSSKSYILTIQPISQNDNLHAGRTIKITCPRSNSVDRKWQNGNFYHLKNENNRKCPAIVTHARASLVAWSLNLRPASQYLWSQTRLLHAAS